MEILNNSYEQSTEARDPFDDKLEWLTWTEALSVNKYEDLKKYNEGLWNDIKDIHTSFLDDILSKKKDTNERQSFLDDIANYKKTYEYDVAVQALISAYKKENKSDKTGLIDSVLVHNKTLRECAKKADFAWMEWHLTDPN